MAHDSPSPGEWEAPTGFFETQREPLLTAVRTRARGIEEQLGIPVKYDDQYQDASCVADLYLGAEDRCQAVIRFSSFGRRAVIFWWGEGVRRPIRSPLEPQLLPLVEQGGFHVIPAEILARPYDSLHGRCSGLFNDPMTWFERYFDYL